MTSSFIGSVIKVKLVSGAEFEGELIAHDVIETNTIFLKDKANTHMIKTQYITEVVPIKRNVSSMVCLR
jgi:hypothetical protein